MKTDLPIAYSNPWQNTQFITLFYLIFFFLLLYSYHEFIEHDGLGTTKCPIVLFLQPNAIAQFPEIEEFSPNRPLGRFGLVVAMSVYISVFLYMGPFPQDGNWP